MLRRRGYLLAVAGVVALLIVGFAPSIAGVGGFHGTAVRSSAAGTPLSPHTTAVSWARTISSHPAVHPASHSEPLAAGSGPVTIGTALVTKAASETLNFTFQFMLNLTNASIDFHNVSIVMNLTWVATNTQIATATSCSTSGTCTQNNTQFPLPTALATGPWGKGNTSAQEVVSFKVTSDWAMSGGFNGGNYPQGQYNLSAYIQAWNSTNLAIPKVHFTGVYAFFLQNTVLTVTDVSSSAVSTVPFTFWYTLNLTNAAIDAANLSLTLQLVWMAPGCGSGSLFGGAECPVLATVNSCASPCVTNATQFQLPKAALGPAFAWHTRGAQETLGWNITGGNSGSLNSTGVFGASGGQYAQGTYQINVYVTMITNSSNALTTPINAFTPVTPPATSFTTVVAITVPTLTVSTVFALFQALPATLNFNVSVTNATPDVNNLTLNVEIQFVLSSGATELVTNNSVAVNGTGSNTTYSVSIDQAFIGASNFAGGALPTGRYLTTVWMGATNSVTAGSAAWTPVIIGRSQPAYFIINPMMATFLSPAANSTDNPVGNVTFSIAYSGDFVNGANLTILSGTTPVFASGIFHSGTGTQAASVNWPATGPGTYTAEVTLTAPSQAPGVFKEQFTVTSAGSGVVYLNHSEYRNASIIPGLSPSVGGTLLLVVGLIIGMIVALFLGRMMWGTARPSAAPQQWSPKTANECSVCHQSFATEAELKDHQKSAHGIT